MTISLVMLNSFLYVYQRVYIDILYRYSVYIYIYRLILFKMVKPTNQISMMVQ